MTNNLFRQNQEELLIFERFAHCEVVTGAGYNIDLESVKKETSFKHPDIYCRTYDGHELAFELVEAKYGKQTGFLVALDRLQRVCDEEINKLEGDKRKILKAKYDQNNIGITIQIQPNGVPSKNKSTKYIRNLISTLLSMSSVKINSGSCIFSDRFCTLIFRKKTGDRLISFSSAIHTPLPESICLNAINSKLAKEYDVQCDRHLIVYSEQWDLSDNHIRDYIYAKVNTECSKHQFSVVWIYSIGKYDNCWIV